MYMYFPVWLYHVDCLYMAAGDEVLWIHKGKTTSYGRKQKVVIVGHRFGDQLCRHGSYGQKSSARLRRFLSRAFCVGSERNIQ